MYYRRTETDRLASAGSGMPGPYRDWPVVAAYKKALASTGQQRMEALRVVSKRSFSEATKQENLHAAFGHLSQNGGDSPGPNGHRYDDYDPLEVWDLTRCLRDAIRGGDYRPGKARRIRKPKTSGQGTRRITLRNIEDRVVARGIHQIIAPIFRLQFAGSPLIRSRRDAVAMADQLASEDGRRVWIVDDIRNAFDQVPIKRLLDLVRRALPEDTARLVERFIQSRQNRGISQGCPLSPLLLDVYLYHFLDRPWQTKHPELPLLRTVDDVLIPCRTRDEALQAYQSLRDLLRPAGMPLKGSTEASIKCLACGDEVRWLGFRFEANGAGLRIQMSDRVWHQLEERLAEAHPKPVSSISANQTLIGWISAMGPCYSEQTFRKTYKRIAQIARRYAFTEIPAAVELQQLWVDSYQKWLAIRDEISKT